MDVAKFKQELNEFIQALTEPEIWQNLSEEKRHAITGRAIADILTYVGQFTSKGICLDLPEPKRAIFEQTLHLAKQFYLEDKGKVVLEESVSGFGSRRYREPDLAMLSERAKKYLDSYLKQNNIVRLTR